ncbi:anthranilate phosphoribosyltransferase [Chitinivibrio alkaliphilus]|uniref:Anthranilate phosphoribosyltransferase n=1 Tax=Chitinivibrio alkaliphilus ACht1 TaxID=1313304 RepID=U7DBA0_9BACT|nr:anthranilate phosphoribosyltransferase [Chitinivibrio alkaliphilus]ERP31700.1 anthranilate phosphoribosyltransferase [Chitinivibrio alkaliphilus ACht1]
MKDLLRRLTQGEELTTGEAHTLLIEITEGKHTSAQIGALLALFSMRQITPAELDGFRRALLEKAVIPDLGTRDAIDMCGTGGDGKNTFNISTLASLVVAGAGYPVIKHGNYGVSSSCGSTTILEACGYTPTSDAARLREQLREHNFCYLHAPLFHPSMKSVGPIRKELGFKTFFNMIGPLVNPVQPVYQYVGVFAPFVGDIYNEILQSCRTRYTIVHSYDGYDECSLTDTVRLTGTDGFGEYTPSELGAQVITPDKLHGETDLSDARDLFLRILENKGSREQQEVVRVNAALAIQTINSALSLPQAMEKAAHSLDSGAARRVLAAVVGESS